MQGHHADGSRASHQQQMHAPATDSTTGSIWRDLGRSAASPLLQSADAWTTTSSNASEHAARNNG